MSRLSAVTLDLSRFPAPLAIRGVDFEAIVSARIARLKALFDAGQVPYDVETLLTDPATILERADAYQEVLTLARVNDAVRAVMVAFATGSDLDHLGAFYGVKRREITSGKYENDAEFRKYVLLAPEAWSAAGPIGAYVFHAGQADPRVLNVDVWSPKPGEVKVAVQARDGDRTAPRDLVLAVSAYLRKPNIKPLTDQLSVRSVVNIPYQIRGTAYVLPGPDPQAAKTAAVESLTAMAAARWTPARDVPLSAIHHAAMVGAVDKFVLQSPTADIARGNGEAAYCTGIDVAVKTYDG